LGDKNVEMTLKLNVPDLSDMSEMDMRLFLAAKLFEAGKLSSGQAAALADLSKRAFLEIIGKYGVSIFSQTEEELASDFANANQLLQ
jgi:predicted HTH domain antitoxin